MSTSNIHNSSGYSADLMMGPRLGVESVVRKMHFHEAIIEKLLQAQNYNSIPFIERKIVHLEELVLQFADCPYDESDGEVEEEPDKQEEIVNHDESLEMEIEEQNVAQDSLCGASGDDRVEDNPTEEVSVQEDAEEELDDETVEAEEEEDEEHQEGSKDHQQLVQAESVKPFSPTSRSHPRVSNAVRRQALVDAWRNSVVVLWERLFDVVALIPKPRTDHFILANASSATPVVTTTASGIPQQIVQQHPIITDPTSASTILVTAPVVTTTTTVDPVTKPSGSSKTASKRNSRRFNKNKRSSSKDAASANSADTTTNLEASVSSTADDVQQGPRPGQPLRSRAQYRQRFSAQRQVRQTYRNSSFFNSPRAATNNQPRGGRGGRRSSSSRSVSSDLDRSSGDVDEEGESSMAAAATSTSGGIREPVLSNSTSTSSTNVSAVQQTKDLLRVQFEQALDQMPIVEDVASQEMRQLLSLIARGVRLIGPYRTHQDLQDAILECILPKLPAALVAKFVERATEVEEKTLYVLKYLLLDEMAECYSQLRDDVHPAIIHLAAAAAESSNDDVLLSDTIETILKTGAKACYYCKVVGHLSYECKELKSMLCFRCFQPGHKARDCGIRCYKCGIKGHIKKNCQKNITN